LTRQNLPFRSRIYSFKVLSQLDQNRIREIGVGSRRKLSRPVGADGVSQNFSADDRGFTVYSHPALYRHSPVFAIWRRQKD